MNKKKLILSSLLLVTMMVGCSSNKKPSSSISSTTNGGNSTSVISNDNSNSENKNTSTQTIEEINTYQAYRSAMKSLDKNNNSFSYFGDYSYTKKDENDQVTENIITKNGCCSHTSK